MAWEFREAREHAAPCQTQVAVHNLLPAEHSRMQACHVSHSKQVAWEGHGRPPVDEEGMRTDAMSLSCK